jgi:4-diphosphocytidyl-2-C-methyl-D-erythritol kinase
MRLRLNAYAKINLFLDVLRRREDGYHDIRSVMQTVSLHDTLTVEVSEGNEIVLSSDMEGLPLGEENLAYRAARRFLDTAGITAAVSIHIEKQIPVSAGLAGGSTDAAAVLVALNRMHGEPLDLDALCALGKTLGADVPFCIRGGTCEVSGIGDGLHVLSPMPPLPMVVCKRGEGISTPWAYRRLDELYDNFTGKYEGGTAKPGEYDALLRALSENDPSALSNSFYNVFESVVLPVHGEASALRVRFVSLGASAVLLSGSGPSVFGVFQTFDDARRAAEVLNAEAEREVAFAVLPITDADIAKSICITSPIE